MDNAVAVRWHLLTVTSDKCEELLLITDKQHCVKLLQDSMKDVSVRTVRRNLALMGYGSRRPTRVPLLTERHRLQRLTWARDHLGWTLDDWKTVAWSDESRFQLIRADDRVRVWCRPHEA